MSVWEIHAYDPTGARKAVLTPEDPVDEIRWAKRGDGDCLEAEVVGARLPIAARDVIAIVSRETEGDAGSSLVRYWGWCVQAGNPRSPHLDAWRFVGGSSRLREIVNRHRGSVTTEDVALAARRFLLTHDGPPVPQARVGLVPHLGSGDDTRFPLTGFHTAGRQPRLERLGDTLDALAELVPAFIVPSGTTYTYDGKTYNAGELVPAVTWGVAAGQATPPASIAYDPGTGAYDGGLVFFRRVDGQLALDEVDDKLTIAWGQATAEVVVDSVAVVVATEATSGAALTTAFLPTSATRLLEPVAYVLEDALGLGLDAWAVVDAATVDALKTAAYVGGVSSLGMSNPGNAFDGDDTTYAANTATWVCWVERDADRATRALRVRYGSHVELQAYLWFGVTTPLQPAQRWVWRLEPTDGEQRDVYLVGPKLVSVNAQVARVGVRFGHPLNLTESIPADSFRVYAIEPLEPDPDVLDGIARSQLRPPPDPGAVVDVPNRILEPQPRVVLTLADGDTVTARVGSLECEITRGGGLATRLRLENELPPELQAERDLLARLLPSRDRRRGRPGGSL